MRRLSPRRLMWPGLMRLGWVPSKTGWSLVFGLIVLLAASGCQFGVRSAGSPAVVVEPKPVAVGGTAAGSQSAQSASGLPTMPVQAPPPAQPFAAKLQVEPAKAEIGKTVEVRGSGYPAGAEVELVWYTMDGRYELDGGTEFVGARFESRPRVIAKARADGSGNLSTRIEVPLDYGGPHELRGRVDGQELSQGMLNIAPTYSMTPREGPVGTMIELKIVGMDWRPPNNTWQVVYDNRYVGFMSAVTARAKAIGIARFRAAGPVGDHLVSAWHNAFNPIPYLNWMQGPYKDTPNAEFTFKVTADNGPPPAVVEDYSATDNPWPVPATSPGKLTLSVDRGAVGTPTTLRGSGLPANTDLQLRWATMVGNRVTESGFSEDTRELGTVRTWADGTLTKEWTIPDDLGGHHRIDLAADGKVVAAAGLVIQPSLLSFGPTRVRVGEEIKIHLKGVGWTTYDNTYAVTYDNSYIGYVCGFSTNGDVQFTIKATGLPGTHLIDLYPTIYKGKERLPPVYSIPMLTYAEDHPQRITPAMRLAVEVIP